MGVYPHVKRGADALLSLLALVCLSPLYLALALAVKLTSPGPALFRQKRVGRGGRLFTIYKFRTMRTDTPRDTATHLLSNPGSYITPLGAFLRRSSLDELPQFFNVLKGDMSIVGPRPALYNQYDLIAAREKAGVNRVRPGITGWAQINGRDELPLPVKVQYDREYVENLSLRMDVRCFFGSIWAVLRADGVREGGTGGKKSA
ncbi:MAG TPA: sugar transferase [Candidatus Pullichristensenella stercorigallinarum]|uniref:Sugar transferase n=1 Tax=Candidatus Pullichristensenella stercorigallinarum TaxID=2840909 RepID=A0A9D0ZK05_9FIRM|nr:sugar transferase [Candidatus Pullichristensenella stercorigallinarum]